MTKKKQYSLNVGYPLTGEFLKNQEAIEEKLGLGRAQWSGAGFGMRDLGWEITEFQRPGIELVLKVLAEKNPGFEWEIRIYDDTND